MIRGTKVYITTVTVLFLLVIAVTIMTRFSFKGSVTLKQLQASNDLNDYTVQFGDDAEVNDVFKTINDYDDLKEKSKVIAKVHVTDERKLSANAVYTKVIVKDIYKSDQSFNKNDAIYIYEPVCFEEEFEIFDSSSGYQLMRTNDDYYVFLNELPTAERYVKSEKEKISFVPSTLKYSVYSTKNNKIKLLDKKRIDGDKEEYKYADVKELDILTYNNGALDKYKIIKKNIIKDLEGKI